MNNQRKSNLTALHMLLGYMGKRRILLLLAILTATFSTALGMAPYLIVGLIAEKILEAGHKTIKEVSLVIPERTITGSFL